MNNIIGPSPFPFKDRDGRIIKNIVKIIKLLSSIFKKPSKEGGNTESNNSLENIERIVKIFTDFKEQVHLRTIDVEKGIEKQIDYYVEELNRILIENDEKVSKYGIHTKRIERQINKISSKVNGTIDNELSKIVSLNNIECKEIVKMIPGAKKEEAMRDFFIKAVNKALEVCCEEMHSTLEEIYNDVELEIFGAIESIQKQARQLKDNFASIDENNYEETMTKQIIDAYFLSDTCDLIIDLL